MSETCDRCGPAVRAMYRVARRGELYLCLRCADRLWPSLAAQGWSLWFVGAWALKTRTPLLRLSRTSRGLCPRPVS